MIGDLEREPERFDFFQAVRLLEWHFHRHADERQTVGKDAPPDREIVRFRSLPALSFPGSPVASLKPIANPAHGKSSDDGSPYEMVVTFLGLIGPCGALPEHYTTLILERMRDRDHALRRFLDLFDHRAISHFYRAWEKYRIPFAYERCQRDGGDDLFTQCLFSLVGFGTQNLRGRVEPADDTFLYYGGHFACQTRSAAALQVILADYFGLPIEVQQFRGQWLLLNDESRSRLTSRDHPRGQNAQLGADAVLGTRIWDVQSKFRLLIGPIPYRQFHRLMPSGDRLLALVQLTRTYVGAEFDFDVQLVLRAGEVPECRLGETGERQPRLGWNTWLRSQPFERDAHDAVFALPVL